MNSIKNRQQPPNPFGPAWSSTGAGGTTGPAMPGISGRAQGTDHHRHHDPGRPFGERDQRWTHRLSRHDQAEAGFPRFWTIRYAGGYWHGKYF